MQQLVRICNLYLSLCLNNSGLLTGAPFTDRRQQATSDF
jgi:hypothetical protein